MKELVAKNIFRRSDFKSYSEFYLALAIGNRLYERGMALNMDGMFVNPELVPNDMIKYYKKLINDGAITLSMYEKGTLTIEEAGTFVDTSYFNKIELVKDNGATLDWSFDWVKSAYGEYSSVFSKEFTKLGNTLVHVVADHIVNVLADGVKKKLVVHIDSHKAKSSFIYVHIVSCLKTLNWLNDYIELDIDLDGYKVDLDYSIFCNNGYVAGYYRMYSVNEKLALLEKYGMQEGAILELWTREGMCDNNKFGHITEVSVIRIDEIGDDFIGITSIALNKTKEEIEQDYYDIDESVRSLFVDILGKKASQSLTELKLYGVGIENHFYDEEKYITKIDTSASAEVTKLVTIDGKVRSVKMSEVDAIYWLLCQNEVEFDKELYKKMYYTDSEPLWEIYN